LPGVEVPLTDRPPAGQTPSCVFNASLTETNADLASLRRTD